MKKLSVLLVAAAVAISASAGMNFKTTHALKANKKMVNKEMTKMNVKNLKADKASFRVITEQPEGELKSYNRAGFYVYVSNGYLYSGQQDGNRMDIVYGEDGKVYMKNVICGIGSYFGDSWVEGTIEGNEIHVPMGQSIYWSDQYQADVVLAMGNTYQDEQGYWGFEIDDRATEAVYVIDGQTITLQGTEDQEAADDLFGYGLSAYWSDDNSWSGFIEWNTVLTEREPVVTPDIITEIPEGCQVYTYFRNSATIYSSLFGISGGKTDGKFTVAFDVANGDVYIQNPAWWHDGYNTWVKGTYTYGEEGVFISIPTGQYLTWSDEAEYGIVLGMGSTYVYEDVDPESGESGYYLGTELDERATEIQFMIDDDTIYLLNTEGDINAEFPENYNAYGMFCYWSDDQSFSAVEFANRDEYGQTEPLGYIVNLVPAVPANPTADNWIDNGDESGYSRFYFTLPTTDVDGNMIDPEHVSYSVYVDNGNGPEVFTFDAATYSYDLTEDLTEIPYSIYGGGYDFRNGYVYFYRTNAEGFDPLFTQNIGIQAHYTVDGVKNSSDIVWLYDVESGVNEMNADKAVASVRYYNVAGQQIAQPSGMTIKVTTYTDGTTSAVKVVK
jgi:hypothetical protein